VFLSILIPLLFSFVFHFVTSTYDVSSFHSYIILHLSMSAKKVEWALGHTWSNNWKDRIQVR